MYGDPRAHLEVGVWNETLTWVGLTTDRGQGQIMYISILEICKEYF